MLEPRSVTPQRCHVRYFLRLCIVGNPDCEGAGIEASRDDLFLLRLNEDSGSGYVWTFDELRDAGLQFCGMGLPTSQIDALALC